MFFPLSIPLPFLNNILLFEIMVPYDPNMTIRGRGLYFAFVVEIAGFTIILACYHIVHMLLLSPNSLVFASPDTDFPL